MEEENAKKKTMKTESGIKSVMSVLVVEGRKNSSSVAALASKPSLPQAPHITASPTQREILQP